MKNLKWVVVALVVGFMLFGMGAFAQKQLTIGISTDAGYPARAIEVIGIYESAKQAGNVKVIEQNADNDSTKQLQQIKSLVDQGVNALVICAVDMNTIKTALDYANQKKVIVTLYDRFVTHPAVKFTGGYDSYADGVACAGAIKTFNDGKEHVVFELVGNLADTNALKRRDGFHKIIDTMKNLKVVQIQTDWSTDKALAGMENALQKYPNVWAIFNASSHMDGSILTALKEANRLEKVGDSGHVIWVSLAAEPPGPQITQDGYIDYLMPIPLDEMGFKIYDAIMLLSQGKKPADNKYYCKTYGVKAEDIEKEWDSIWSVKYRSVLGW